MAEQLSFTPFSIRDGAQLMLMPPISQETIWGGIPLHECGASSAFFGPPGSHKSRLVLHLAVHQILGRPFAGMPVYNKPLRWLFLNGENSLARLQHDMSGFARTLTPDDIALVGEHLAVTSLEVDADGDLMLDDRDGENANYYRIAEAVARTNCEVMVVDTLPAVCPDELDAAKIRYALGTIRKACAASSRAPVSIIYIGHARPGVREEAKATTDPLSYQRGNRVLNGILRCSWNVRRCEVVGDEAVDAHVPTNGIRVGVELLHAKSNNGQLLPPTTIVLNDQSFLYEHVPDFNHAAWDETLQRMAKANVSQSPAAKAAEAKAVIKSSESRIIGILQTKGPLTISTLVREMQAAAISSSARNAKELITFLRERKTVFGYSPKSNRPMKIMTPEQYADIVGL